MRRINRCLNTRLIDICQRTVHIEELNSKLIALLPPSMQTHCHVGSFNRGCMVIMVNHAEWASQLRYLLPELRDKLRKEGRIYQLSSIKITTTVNELTPSPKAPISPKLSNKAREIIQKSSDECAYEPLKLALHRLAQ